LTGVQRIPEEPAADDSEAVMVMVRMPDGRRSSRRFRRADPLQAVFDYLDVQVGADC
jgi:FAS-associated factor 2